MEDRGQKTENGKNKVVGPTLQVDYIPIHPVSENE